MTYINFNFMLFVSSALEPSLDERGDLFTSGVTLNIELNFIVTHPFHF